MANRLAAEQSPYLLQHKDNPVEWYAWGDEAFQKARAEVKNQFRVNITTLKPLDNNPLKFSANADDA